MIERLARGARSLLTPSALLRLLVLFVLLFGIAKWQRAFAEDSSVVAPGHGVTASTGLNEDKRFFYFLYHLNLYPIASDVPTIWDTPEEAKRLMREEPAKLRQDQGTTFRSGDRGRTYLFFVDAWLHHRGLNASVKPAHEIAFTLSLMALMISFWAIRRTAAGFFLVLLLGSNPFQLWVVFKQENVFSWAITAMIGLLALHLPLMEKPRASRSGGSRLRRYYPWVAAILGGLFLAFVRNFRSEPSALIGSIWLVYATMTWLRKRTRVGLAFAALFALWIGTQSSTWFFDKKLEQAKAAVATVHGPVYAGPVAHFHEFWHAVWCGLGDFDTKYGYQWEDRAAYRSADPELKKRNPGLFLDPNHWVQPRFWDPPTNRYEVYYFETPHYHDVIRDKILGDIKKDPLWYLNILKQRALRTLTEVTPVGFATAEESFYVEGKLLGLLFVPVFFVLVWARRWTHLKLLVFSAPLSSVPLILYSAGGMTNYSTFHLFALWLLGLLFVEGARTVARHRGRFRLFGNQ
jgi:hypothetical protein